MLHNWVVKAEAAPPSASTKRKAAPAARALGATGGGPAVEQGAADQAHAGAPARAAAAQTAGDSTPAQGVPPERCSSIMFPRDRYVPFYCSAPRFLALTLKWAPQTGDHLV